jgi:hypothetical protein
VWILTVNQLPQGVYGSENAAMDTLQNGFGANETVTWRRREAREVELVTWPCGPDGKPVEVVVGVKKWEIVG